MSTSWNLKIDITYLDKDTMINTFRQIVQILEDRNFAKLAGGNHAASYSIRGPKIERLSDDEILKLRELIK